MKAEQSRTDTGHLAHVLNTGPEQRRALPRPPAVGRLLPPRPARAPAPGPGPRPVPPLREPFLSGSRETSGPPATGGGDTGVAARPAPRKGFPTGRGRGEPVAWRYREDKDPHVPRRLVTRP